MRRDEDDTGGDDASTDRVRQILSQIEESDFERLEPPALLWERIEASITAGSPRKPPSRELSAGTVVEYWIDAADNVTDVGQGWATFARDNDAPELAVPPSDRSLWTYFDNDETRELWQLLVERVRVTQKSARVPLRCDASHARRWFDITITPDADGRVHFRSVLAFEQARPPVALVDRSAERDDGLEPVSLCSWCARGQHGSRRLDVEELVQSARLLEQTSMPPIAYGICASCRDEMSAELLVPGGVGESTA